MKYILIVIILGGITVSVFGQTATIYLPYRIGNKWGLANQDGEQLFKAKFEETFPSTTSRIRFKKGRKYGYINSKGVIVLKPIYSEASDFFPYYETAITQITFKGATCYIDINGNFIEPKAGCGQGRMNRSNMMKTFEVNGKYGVVTLGGDTVVKPTFKKITNYNDGEFVFAQDFNSKMGIISSMGDTLYQFSLDSVEYNSKRGYFRIYENGKVGIIDINGNIQALPRYENLNLYPLYSIYGTLFFYTKNEDKIIGYIHKGIEFWK